MGEYDFHRFSDVDQYNNAQIASHCENCGEDDIREFQKTVERDVVCLSCGYIVGEDRIENIIHNHEIYDYRNTSYEVPRRNNIYSSTKYMRRNITQWMPNDTPNHIISGVEMLYARMTVAKEEAKKWNRKKFIDTRCFLLFALHCLHLELGAIDYEDMEYVLNMLSRSDSGLRVPKMMKTFIRNREMWNQLKKFLVISEQEKKNFLWVE